MRKLLWGEVVMDPRRKVAGDSFKLHCDGVECWDRGIVKSVFRVWHSRGRDGYVDEGLKARWVDPSEERFPLIVNKGTS